MIKYLKQQYRLFDHWLRYQPPGAMSTRGWRLFDEEFKEVAPIRHWMTKEFKRNYIYPIKWKYERAADWVRYRTTHKYHVVKTGLKPSYYEIEELMLHSSFNMLKDFVEVEQAYRTYCWSPEYKKRGFFERYMPFYRHFIRFRCPEIGLSHFEWAATLDDPKLPPHEQSPRQAESAREVIALYKWWVNERPVRKLPDYKKFDDQGLGDMAQFDDDFDRTAEDFKAYSEGCDERSKQEDDWIEEDEVMLIRLVKIRRHLWS